ncbi:hypothetical protein M9458_035818, partial [Cirrhinus mrigala]
TNYPERIVVDLEERRAQSLQDVAAVRRRFRQFVDQRSGCDMVPVPARLVQEALGSMEDVVSHEGTGFLLPVITRMEFKHQSEDPVRQDNPYNAVLKGYVSRKRDETVAFLNERDFTASVIERLEKDRPQYHAAGRDVLRPEILTAKCLEVSLFPTDNRLTC